MHSLQTTMFALSAAVLLPAADRSPIENRGGALEGSSITVLLTGEEDNLEILLGIARRDQVESGKGQKSAFGFEDGVASRGEEL
jgi:hypothetical protein